MKRKTKIRFWIFVFFCGKNIVQKKSKYNPDICDSLLTNTKKRAIFKLYIVRYNIHLISLFHKKQTVIAYE